MLLQKLTYEIGVADILQWAELVCEAPQPGGSDNGQGQHAEMDQQGPCASFFVFFFKCVTGSFTFFNMVV